MNIKREDLKDYETIIIDTGALDSIANYRTNNSFVNLTWDDWAFVKAQLIGLITKLLSFGKDVILNCHDDCKDGVWQPDLKGSAWKDLHKSAQAAGRIMVSEKRELVLSFTITNNSHTKDPCELKDIIIPHPNDSEHDLFLDGIIQRIKDAGSGGAEVRNKTLLKYKQFEEALKSAKSTSDINGLIESSKELGPKYKSMLACKAGNLGFKYNKKNGDYIDE